MCGYRFETQPSNINDHNHGSFLTYKFTDIGFEIIPDIHGRELVFYYQNTEKVFISNSLYLLTQTLNDNFHNDILNIMINTIKSSDLFVFLSQQEHWAHNTAKELKLNNFDSQFVTQNKNQIAKLYQMCLFFFKLRILV